MLDDLERAVIDGVNTVKSLCNNPKLVAGAGACEIELAARVQKLANSTKGLEQYAHGSMGKHSKSSHVRLVKMAEAHPPI